MIWVVLPKIEDLFKQLDGMHHRLCPRQVLGVRMGIYARKLLNLPLPSLDKRLHTFIETDGCALDGVMVATGCSVGRRTMHLLDFGKVAATFVDRNTDQSIRIHPIPQARFLARRYAPDAPDDWQAYLLGYQRMPDNELLLWESVRLTVSLETIISREAVRVLCALCGEEIYNEREVTTASGLTVCLACAGETYYAPAETDGSEPFNGI